MEPQVRFDDQIETHTSQNSEGMAAHVARVLESAAQLMRQEVALAKAELHAEWLDAKKAGQFYVGALAGLMVGAILLSMCLVHILSAVGVALWLSYGLVALLFIGAGLGGWKLARDRAKAIDPVPRQTLETMKENVQWIKQQT